MNRSSQDQTLSDNFIDSRRLITGLKHALDVSYTRVLDRARAHWDEHFEANDPANACVRVRITNGKPTAGVIRKPKATLVYGVRQITA
jgi:hypothetical protein